MSPDRRRRPPDLAVAVVAVIVVGGLVGGRCHRDQHVRCGHLYERALDEVDRLGAAPAGPGPLDPADGRGDRAVTDIAAPGRDDDARSDAVTLAHAESVRPVRRAGRRDDAHPDAKPSPTPTRVPSRKSIDVELAARPGATSSRTRRRRPGALPPASRSCSTYFGKGNTSNSFQTELMARVDRVVELQPTATTASGVRARCASRSPPTGCRVRGPGVPTRADGAPRRRRRHRADERARPADGLARRAYVGDERLSGRRRSGCLRERQVTGAYILDPWYPDVSSIWGPSDPPGDLPGQR